jgi:hypothetical protein
MNSLPLQIPEPSHQFYTCQNRYKIYFMNFNTLLNLMGTLGLVAAGAFAGIQIRQIIKHRARVYALQLLHSFQTPEFQNALHMLVDFPEGLTKKEIEVNLGDKIISFYVMFGTFEALGVLVYKREIEISLVEDFFSGVIILAWKKFRNYIYEIRALGNRPTIYEWFQWIAEQIEKRESKNPPIPAHIAFNDWKE